MPTWSALRFVGAGIALLVAPLGAQTAVQFAAGVTSSGVLISDGVLHTTLQPAIAPTLGIAIALPAGAGPYRVRFEGRYSRSTLNVTTADGTTDHLGSLATLEALLIAEGPLSGKLRWQVGGGALFYRPSDDQGVFLDGPVQRWLILAGAVFTQPLTPRLALVLTARVDAHSFVTDVLRARDYVNSQGVRRFSFAVGVERTL